MTTKAMNEEQMVFFVRNALLVAGQEIGNGDQWPVVKDTIYKMMKDFEDLKIERAVNEELKVHYADIINNIEGSLHLCPDDLRPSAEAMIRNLRELYQARFEPLGYRIKTAHDELPIHAQRMIEIIKTLEVENE